MGRAREHLQTLLKQCASIGNSTRLRILSSLLIVVFCGFACWLFYLTFWANDPRSLLIELQTGQFTITLVNDVELPIQSDYLVKLDRGERLRFTKSPDGSIETSGMLTIHKGSTVRVRRMGHGRISLMINKGAGSASANQPHAGNLAPVATPVDITDKQLEITYSKEDPNNQESEDAGWNEQAVADEVEILIENYDERQGNPLIFSFIGFIEDIPHINELAGNIPPIIYTGSLHLVNNTFWGNDFYEVGPFTVHTGDGLEFALSESEPFNGFFTCAKDKPGLQLVANSQFSGKVGITRFNHTSLYLQASPWQKLANDKILLLFWSIMAFLFPFIFTLR
jgi:hypothetical protein